MKEEEAMRFLAFLIIATDLADQVEPAVAAGGEP